MAKRQNYYQVHKNKKPKVIWELRFIEDEKLLRALARSSGLAAGDLTSLAYSFSLFGGVVGKIGDVISFIDDLKECEGCQKKFDLSMISFDSEGISLCPDCYQGLLDECATWRCKVCGCTQNDCQQCIEKTGAPCSWIDTDLCSACEEESETPYFQWIEKVRHEALRSNKISMTLRAIQRAFNQETLKPHYDRNLSPLQAFCAELDFWNDAPE